VYERVNEYASGNALTFVTKVLLTSSIGPPLLATGMTRSDYRACSDVSSRGSDYGTACRNPL
jgi:hypothetical protein